VGHGDDSSACFAAAAKMLRMTVVSKLSMFPLSGPDGSAVTLSGKS
jgi:hypothetical protein